MDGAEDYRLLSSPRFPFPFEVQMPWLCFVYVGHSVLFGVQLDQMRLYDLNVNGDQVCSVEMDVPTWMPVRPRLNATWLRSVVGHALRNYFRRVAVQPK
jgi:hypothetical protein